jgi:signal transduction histidine kinase
MITLMGGTINAESEHGKGTRFIIVLPLLSSEEAKNE